jgi:cell division protein FtsI (penicillin-binding protein 3)
MWNKVREHPIGKIAERTIGYERKLLQVLMTVKGLNGRTETKWKRKMVRFLSKKIAKGNGSLFVMLMK